MGKIGEGSDGGDSQGPGPGALMFPSNPHVTADTTLTSQNRTCEVTVLSAGTGMSTQTHVTQKPVVRGDSRGQRLGTQGGGSVSAGNVPGGRFGGIASGQRESVPLSQDRGLASYTSLGWTCTTRRLCPEEGYPSLEDTFHIAAHLQRPSSDSWNKVLGRGGI